MRFLCAFFKKDIKMRIILASKSPRRREILTTVGLDFEIITSEADESSDEQNPEKRVEILAERKGRAVEELLTEHGESLCDTLIIASDTLVHMDGRVLGKPIDRDNAREMLSSLSGREHYVSSGVYLSYEGVGIASHSTTAVRFADMTDTEIEKYLDTDEPYDKAGSYGIQGIASLFIEGIEGDYFNVVGLPIRLLYTMADKTFGIKLF